MSERRSAVFPFACSGDMYAAVPEDDAGARRDRAQRRGVGDVGRQRIVAERLGQAEVEDLDRAVPRQLDVRGLQVAVDDAVLVGVLEGLRDLLRDRQRFVDGDRALGDALVEGRALDQLHDQRARPVRFFEAVDRGDVGMVERREDVGLALEADHPLVVGGEGRGQAP